jgi:diguanylate cyclase (GGDEF)-like protein
LPRPAGQVRTAGAENDGDDRSPLPTVTYLPARYDPWVVAVSFLLASFASYVALDLAKRVRTDERRAAFAWWLGGSVSMGTGMWAMHFMGMLSYSLPIPLGYTPGATFLSWAAGVAVSAVALAVASRGALTARRLAVGAVAMGAGICTMHYIGFAALDLAPAIVWDWRLVAASVVVAVTVSAAALVIFSWLRDSEGRRGNVLQAVAALVMGAAVCGMHYTGMAGLSVPAGAICLSADQLGGRAVGTLVTAAAASLLAMTWFTSLLDERMRGRTSLLARSLQLANAQLQSANEELRRRAFVDPLTGLPNRLLLEDRLAHAVALSDRSARPARRLAVLFIDLDGFKPVNDSFGHSAGDTVLREAASRLRTTARESDSVARLGGDEFVLLMEDVESPADAVAMARRLIDLLRLPFQILDRQIQISASIGIVLHPDHGEPEKLLAHADAAMYAAKRTGGGTYALFEPHMNAGALEQLALQSDLRRALQAGQLEMHYQPKVDARRERISGVEALMRWRHPERGMVSPVVFIPIAERFGIINELGNWAIEEVCRQIRAWTDEGVRMRVAINLSVHQLRQDDIVSRIRQALDRHQVEPSQLLCEITESVAMEDIRATQRAFEGLQQIGVYLSIDDFGTGYSSLSTLRQLPARQLKIDRTFVQDLEGSGDARAVVDAVIRLAHALSLRVVAEGVETEGQRDILLSLGCDELQGYFYAKPMSAGTLLAWTEGRKPAHAVDFAPSVMAPMQG